MMFSQILGNGPGWEFFSADNSQHCDFSKKTLNNKHSLFSESQSTETKTMLTFCSDAITHFYFCLNSKAS